MRIRQCLYIPLDALIDTRLGLLKQKWPEKFKTVDIKAYRERITFHVWKLFGIGKDEWLAAWNSRDVDVLLNSAPTELATRLRIILGHLAVNAMTMPVVEKPEIVVDVAPYRLTEDERSEIQHVVEFLAPEGVVVTTEYISDDHLSPELISSRFDGMFLYDLVTWIEKQTEALKLKQVPKVVIHYPAVLHEDDPIVIEHISKSDSNPFDDISRRCAGLFTLSAIDPCLLSIAQPAEEAD